MRWGLSAHSCTLPRSEHRFTNTALIALLLYNRLPNGLSVPVLSQLRILAVRSACKHSARRSRHVPCSACSHRALPRATWTTVCVPTVQGTYEGFPSGWYPVVGVAVVITMILNLAVPHAKPLTWSFVKGPCKRCCCKRFAAPACPPLGQGGWRSSALLHRWVCLQLCRGVLTQHQMDKLYAGPRWEIDVRYTFVMNTVMVAMFFCGGLPILLPLTAASIAITFMLDKWLCECCARPIV